MAVHLKDDGSVVILSRSVLKLHERLNPATFLVPAAGLLVFSCPLRVLLLLKTLGRFVAVVVAVRIIVNGELVGGM